VNTFPITITAFRCVPSLATDPLATGQTVDTPGRWNTQEVPALYTFLTPSLAGQWIDVCTASLGVSTVDITPAFLPDMLVLNCSLRSVGDLTPVGSLYEVGLPETYPEGYRTVAAYPNTQPIAAQLFATGCEALLVRSATAPVWTDHDRSATELVIFADPARCVKVIDRIPYSRWTAIDSWPRQYLLDQPTSASFGADSDHSTSSRDKEIS
jgi:hypothetical protein